MATIWLAESGINDTKKDLIAKYHPDLALIEEEIIIIFKEKGGKHPGKASKSTPILNLILPEGQKVTFVITLGADSWNEMNSKQQIALLDRCLCSLRVEESEDGNQKFTIAQPDVAFFRDEIARHGFWSTSGADPTDTLVDVVFGPDKATPGKESGSAKND